MSDDRQTGRTAAHCKCGGPPCRTCPEVSCRYMTRNDWIRAMLDRADALERGVNNG